MPDGRLGVGLGRLRVRGCGVRGGREAGGSAGARRRRSPKLSSQCALDPGTGRSSRPAAASAPWGRAWSRHRAPPPATRGRLHFSVSLSGSLEVPSGLSNGNTASPLQSQSLSSLDPACVTVYPSPMTEAPSRQRSSRPRWALGSCSPSSHRFPGSLLRRRTPLWSCLTHQALV